MRLGTSPVPFGPRDRGLQECSSFYFLYVNFRITIIVAEMNAMLLAVMIAMSDLDTP